jgi:hypothetical protein
LVRFTHCAIGLRTLIYKVMNEIDIINRRFSVAPMMDCASFQEKAIDL